MDHNPVIKLDFLTTVSRYYIEIDAARSLRSLDEATDFTSSRIPVGHAPCHLNKPVYLHTVLNHKITVPLAMIIEYTVNRSTTAIKLQKDRVFELLSFIIALRK